MRLLPGSRASSLWGGNSKAAHPIELPGLQGWISCTPFGHATSGGDVHYVSVCSKGQVSRIALADVAGHGESASSVAERLRRVFQQHTDNWDQSALMRELNEAFKQRRQGRAIRHGRGPGFLPRERANFFSPTPATCPCCGITRRRGFGTGWRKRTPYAKDVAGSAPGPDQWDDVRPDRRLSFIPGDTLLLYTDGITESRERARGGVGPRRIAGTGPRIDNKSAGGARCVRPSPGREAQRVSGQRPPAGRRNTRAAPAAGRNRTI